MKKPELTPETLELLLADLRLAGPSIALTVHPQWATASTVQLGILLQAYQTGVEGAQLLVGAQGGLVGRLQL